MLEQQNCLFLSFCGSVRASPPPRPQLTVCPVVTVVSSFRGKAPRMALVLNTGPGALPGKRGNCGKARAHLVWGGAPVASAWGRTG